jgi:hypothetical protein
MAGSGCQSIELQRIGGEAHAPLQRIFPPDFGEMRAISEGYLNSYFIS